MRVQFWEAKKNSYFLAEVELKSRPRLGAGYFELESLSSLQKIQGFQRGVSLISRGYFDSHLHACWLGEMDQKINLSESQSLEALKERVVQFLLEREGDKAVVEGFGWDQSLWSLKEGEIGDFISRELNFDVPLLLHRICGHAALVNRKFIEQFALPKGKFFLRDEDLNQLHAKLPEPTLKSVKANFLSSQKKFLQWGITAISEMSATPLMLQALVELAQEGKLLIDVQSNFIMGDSGKYGEQPFRLESSQLSPYLGAKACLHLSHAKHYLDGSFGARTAWLKESYCDEQGNFGLQMHANESLLKDCKQHLDRGFALCFHAIGDAALEQALWLGAQLQDSMQDGSRNSGLRHRLEHVQLASSSQVAKIAEQGLWSVNLQPHHRVADRKFIKHRLGEERWRERAYPLKSFLKHRISVSLGSDAPIDSYKPYDIVKSCVDHHNPAEKLSWGEAMTLYLEDGRTTLSLANRELRLGDVVFCQCFGTDK